MSDFILYSTLFVKRILLVTWLALNVLGVFAQEGVSEGRAVRVITEKPGAELYIDGKLVGKTPYAGILAVDSHWIYAVQDSMYSLIERVKVKRGDSVPLTVKLKFQVYVDLGLPSGTLWAACNIGASSPEEYGDYIAFAETHPVNEHTSEEYVYKSKFTIRDDAASVLWGGDWSTPTLAQQQELVNKRYTIPLWTTQNGVNGLLVKSRQNGNSIFLPAGGYSHDGILKEVGEVGNYWSCSLGSSYSNAAYQLYFFSTETDVHFADRFYGRNIRPVRVGKL